MKKLKYVFLTVAIVLVTAFYAISIENKSQDIIADRLPQGALVMNNINQKSTQIPKNEQVVATLDNYAMSHQSFIVSTVVRPEDLHFKCYPPSWFLL